MKTRRGSLGRTKLNIFEASNSEIKEDLLRMTPDHRQPQSPSMDPSKLTNERDAISSLASLMQL